MVSFFTLPGNLFLDYKYFVHDMKSSPWQRALCVLFLVVTCVASCVCLYAYKSYTLDSILAEYLSGPMIEFDIITVYACQFLLVAYDVFVYDFDALWLILHPVLTLFVFWAWMTPLYAAIHIVRMKRLTRAQCENFCLKALETLHTKQRIQFDYACLRSLGRTDSSGNSSDSINFSFLRYLQGPKSCTKMPDHASKLLARLEESETSSNQVDLRCLRFLKHSFGTVSLFVFCVASAVLAHGVWSAKWLCRLFWLSGFSFSDSARLVRSRSYFPTCGKNCFLRTCMGWLRIKLIANHWHPESFLSVVVGAYQTIEYMVCNGDNYELFNSLATEFGDYFPCLFGIGVGNRDNVIRLLTEDCTSIIKDKWFRFGPASSFISNYSDYSTFFLSSSRKACQKGLQVVHVFVGGVTEAFSQAKQGAGGADALLEKIMGASGSLAEALDQVEDGSLDALKASDSVLPAILTRLWQKKKSNQFKQVVGACFSNMFYYLATGQFMESETEKCHLDLVFKPFYMFNDWFQWLLFGNYFVDKQKRCYDSIYAAFLKNCGSDGAPVNKVYKLANESQGDIDLEEAFRLLAVVFNIPSVAPLNLTIKILEKMYDNPAKLVPMWQRDPKNFLLEMLRLYPGVPMVTVFSQGKSVINIGGKEVNFPAHTPMQCCLNLANRDPEVFANPNQFDPTRQDLDKKILTFNGFINHKKGFTRTCPGADFALVLVEYLVDALKPQLQQVGTSAVGAVHVHAAEESVQSVQVAQKESMHWFDYVKFLWHLDWYTLSFWMLASSVCVAHIKNEKNASGEHMKKPSLTSPKVTYPTVLAGKPLPIEDEDMSLKKMKKVFYNLILLWFRVINWMFGLADSKFSRRNLKFGSVQEGVQWREKLFAELPHLSELWRRDSDNGDNYEAMEMVSDAAISRLAFSGMCAYYTRRMSDSDKNKHDFVPALAAYVSDFSELGQFAVRSGYERYGAIAYFDRFYQIVGIYWCHMNRYVKAEEEVEEDKNGAKYEEWCHVKYVWRVSWYAHITVIDHLYFTHFYCANGLVYALTKCLPLDHCLRVMLKPFTHGITNKNTQAVASLSSYRGVIHQTWAFPYSQVMKMFAVAKNKFSDVLKDKIFCNSDGKMSEWFIDKSMWNENEAVFGVKKDWDDFWDVVRHYVDQFFTLSHPDMVQNDDDVRQFMRTLLEYLDLKLDAEQLKTEQVVNILTWLIVTVSGFHEQAGYGMDEVWEPTWCGARLLPGQNMAGVQEYTLMLAVNVVTTLKTPLMTDDWSHLCKNEKDLELYYQFRNDMKKLSQVIEKRNEQRMYPVKSFDPAATGCSAAM